MTATVRRSGFTIPLSLVVLTSTAMLLAGCQSGGASNANQQGTAGSSSSSSAKSQSTASAKPTSGQKPGHASPRIPSPTGKGTGESSAPQSSSGSNARPSSPRANEPRPAASGTGTDKAATPGKTDAPSASGKQSGGASKAPETSGSSDPQAGASPQAQPAAPQAQSSPEPASPVQPPADGSGSADQTTPAPAPAEPADPATPQATSFVPDNLVSEKTAMIVSPSGNIGCDLSAHFAGCGVLSYRSDGTYGQDEMGSPKWWFDLSSGDTPQLGGRGEGAFSLDESFRGAGSSPQVIEYGQSVAFGSWVCSSEETGMTCRNTETGHGVFLSSARYETF
ncbi:hypothetical protein [Actinomyces sp. ZJ308]|uniref:hypothetical protein n=1 Tax=Actinomyces sp. ZJ308 TaxID=2708342 RepID=UPI001422D32E|nr:hypothetical protein [Actinomyces sp. ZJ308]